MINNMITLYLPTTIGQHDVTQSESIYHFLTAGFTVFEFVKSFNGMYMNNEGQFICEEIIEIKTNALPEQVCQCFHQETILFIDQDSLVKLINVHGEIVCVFEFVQEQLCLSEDEAIELQKSWTIQNGGASRKNRLVWSYIT